MTQLLQSNSSILFLRILSRKGVLRFRWRLHRIQLETFFALDAIMTAARALDGEPLFFCRCFCTLAEYVHAKSPDQNSLHQKSMELKAKWTDRPECFFSVRLTEMF